MPAQVGPIETQKMGPGSPKTNSLAQVSDLSTVQRIVEKHGGADLAESQPEHGTTLFFTFRASSSPRVIADQGRYHSECGCQERAARDLVDAIKSALDGGTFFGNVIDEAGQSQPC
jgi:hypothetical protein